MAYEQRRLSWERRIEDVIIEIINEKSERGLRMILNPTPVIQEFKKLLSDVDVLRKSQTAVFSPGNKNDYN